MQWIMDNKEWVFSGIGVFIFSLIATFFLRRKSTITQTQKSGGNSKNYQATGDINIGTKDD
ncbi:hypothetical protein [Parashewanella tropica]|uniref:hypothetical protein n=1 Tax=Parashewanella tropica TaxID=2547970 RepID=UPI00105A5754|nr:hypothetical protein [Parashewanella tropica]